MLKFAYPYQTEETNKELLSSSGSPKGIFSALRDIGYDGIELLVRDLKKLDREQLSRLINKTDLEVAAISTGPMVADDGLTYTSTKKEVRELAIARTIDAIEWGAYFDCPITIGKLRGQIDSDNEEASWRHMKDTFEEVTKYAEKKHVTLLIEPQNKSQLNNLTHTAETLSFISKFNSPALGIMLDTLHMYKEKDTEDFAKLFSLAEEKLGFIHLTDSDRLPPGDGFFNVSNILKAMQSLKNCPYISMEINQQGDSLKMARRSLDYIKKIINKVEKGDENDNKQ